MTEPRTSVPLPAKLLGFAGLLPILALIALGQVDNPGTHSIEYYGIVYAALILVFLGGTWWAFESRAQKPRWTIMILSILPVLIALFGLILTISFIGLSTTISGTVLGGLIALSPLVDRALAARDLTPTWWMRMRWPLSIGLGLLSALCGLLV